MVKYCAAYGCSQRASSSGRSFHTFPKDPEMRRRWIRAVRRKDFTPSSYAVLCSDHFLPDDFLGDQEYRAVKKLKFNAVPSKFDGFFSKEQPAGSRKRRLSDCSEDESDSSTDNSRLIAPENSIDYVKMIRLDHSYAFPSDITLAKVKCDNLQSMLERMRAKEKQKEWKLRRANKKVNDTILELKETIKTTREKERETIAILDDRFTDVQMKILQGLLQDKKCKTTPFSSEVREFARTLFDCSPKAFSLVSQLFTLPSTRTMRRFIANPGLYRRSDSLLSKKKSYLKVMLKK